MAEDAGKARERKAKEKGKMQETEGAFKWREVK